MGVVKAFQKISCLYRIYIVIEMYVLSHTVPITNSQQWPSTFAIFSLKLQSKNNVSQKRPRRAKYCRAEQKILENQHVLPRISLKFTTER